jgi:hypothetical protein
VRGFGLRVGAAFWTAAILALAVASAGWAEKPPKTEKPSKTEGIGKAEGNGRGHRSPAGAKEHGNGHGSPKGEQPRHEHGYGKSKSSGPAEGGEDGAQQPVPSGGVDSEKPGADGGHAKHAASAPSSRKVTLCHATGSRTNPYVVITVSVNATTGNGHGRHDDDLIPAPAGGCPSGAPEDPGGGGANPDPPSEGGSGGGAGHEPPAAGGAAGEGPEPVAHPPTFEVAAAPAPQAELPFTGVPLWLIALLGAAAGTSGALLRRNGRPSGKAAPPASR